MVNNKKECEQILKVWAKMVTRNIDTRKMTRCERETFYRDLEWTVEKTVNDLRLLFEEWSSFSKN